MSPDDLTSEETAEFQTLSAAGDVEKTKAFINKMSCKYDGKAANFGDGNHLTCGGGVGGRRRRRRGRKTAKRNKKFSRKSKRLRKSRKSRKSRK